MATIRLKTKENQMRCPDSIVKEAALTEGDVKHYMKNYYEPLDDVAHGPEHIAQVRKRIAELADKTDYNNKDLADAAAVLHDIGNISDRSKHEIIGAEIVRGDQLLKKRFSKRDINLLVNAVGQHRASTGKPRSHLGKILSDADRLSSFSDPGRWVRRGYDYGLTHAKDLSDEEQLIRTIEYHKEKYGEGGYGLKSLNYPESAEIIKKNMNPVMEAYGKGHMDKIREMAGIKKT